MELEGAVDRHRRAESGLGRSGNFCNIFATLKADRLERLLS